MLALSVIGVLILSVLYAIFKQRQKENPRWSDFSFAIFMITTVAVIFLVIMPSTLIQNDTVQFSVPIDDGTVYSTDDLNGGLQYYIISDGKRKSINDYGYGIAFDIGAENKATWICEETPGWVAPWSWNESCWWEVVAERS